MSEPSTNEILREMARLTALSGRISDVQEKNLTMFPFIFFDGIKEVKIDYDLAPAKSMDDTPTFINSLISYHLAVDESINNELKERFGFLEAAVRTLFWSDVVIEVYFNDQIKYKSRKV